MQRGWRLPEYTVLKEAGPPHKREFTVTCRMESLSEWGMTFKDLCVIVTVFVFITVKCFILFLTAVRNSKKRAKKAAAEKMVAKLQSLSGGSEITWVRRIFLSPVK